MSKINREKFEAWMTAEQAFHGSDFEWDERRNCYSQFGIHIAYKAFQSASRESEAQLTALTSQLESVVAENASVKVMNDCLSEELRSYESDGAFEGPKMHLLWWKVETPATDAFLAEVRASGVDAVSLKISNSIINCRQDEMIGLDEAVNITNEFAAQLRQGGAV